MTFAEYINKFRSVKIIHDIIHRIDYSYIAEFFRFIGILVCEEILIEPQGEKDKNTEIEKKTKYSAQIYVGEREIDQNVADKIGLGVEQYSKLISELPLETINLYDDWELSVGEECEQNDIFSRKVIGHLSNESQKNLLLRVLTKVLESAFGSDDSEGIKAGAVWQLIDIYVDRKLWLHSMNLQYYTKKASKAVSDAKEAFRMSCADLEKDFSERKFGMEKYLYQYALLWCEVKVNLACYFGKEILYYPIDKLSEKCRQFCVDYPRFSNAKVLLGLCYEPSASNVNEALLAFNDALQDVGKECFSAPIYYWMGKYYESFPSRKKDAQKCYQLANRSKIKFRTYFKLAVSERNDGNYDATVELFQCIIDKLNLKMQMDFADPLELEYLFKSYTQQCYAYNKAGRHMKAIKAGENAIKILDQRIDDNAYFEIFYKDEAQVYREILKSRCNLKMVYILLTDSCGKIFDTENMEYYQSKAQNCE